MRVLLQVIPAEPPRMAAAGLIARPTRRGDVFGRSAMVCLVGLVLPLAAQTPPDLQKPPAAAADQAAAAAVPTPAAAAPAPAASPVPTTEPNLTGWIDFGYRFTSGVNGSLETYRSVINLGAGPKLFGAEFTLIDPKKKFFDTMHVRASGWGGDPYGTLHVDASKSKLYRFDADYRDMAYFNNLPSYADPLLTRGIILDQQSFDTRRHLGSYSLEVLPGNWFIPYVAYDRDASSGQGVLGFVANSNEYAVPTSLTDTTNLYRGGVRFEFRRFHATLEEGGTTFNSAQSLYQAAGASNPGTFTAPIFGQTLDLASLAANYGITGSSTYTKALFSSNALPGMDVYGQFLFSQPSSNVNYHENATGNFYLPSEIVFYQSEQYLVSAAAKMPHTTGSLGAEIRPLRRVRMTESWLTDRMHDSGNSPSTQTNAVAGGPEVTAQTLQSSLVSNYNQVESNVYVDVLSHLTLRGGYRYVWGDANDAVLPQGGNLTGALEQAKLRRNVGLGGIVYRPTQKILLTAETEVASSGGVYFNTSLYDYQKVRTQARYQATGSLSLALDFTYLNNDNPTPGINYTFRSQQEAASIFWSPRNGKIFTFQGSYSWASIRSDIFYLVPQTLTSAISNDLEDAHTATALFNVNLGHWGVVAPKLTAGGSLFISSGTRPTSYYQPMAKLWVPLSKHVEAFAQWWFYGYGEAFYPYEGFGTHIAAIGLRYKR
jgi:hypothetical protein